MSVFRRRLMIQQQTPTSDYTQLSYIESTGTQYIDTGMLYDSGKQYTVQTTMAATKGTESWQMNGWDAGGAFGYFSNTLQYGAGDLKGGNAVANTYDDFKHTIMRGTRAKSVLEVNTLPTSSGVAITLERWHSNLAQYVSGYGYLIFATRSGANIAYKMYCKIKNYKIWVDNVLTYDLVPVMRNADSVVGLLNVIDNTFYGNSGTATFLYG